MSNDQRPNIDTPIYRDFCNGMKNQSKEQLRLAGDIARRITKGIQPGKPSDSLTIAASNFIRIESNLENIENNLNKVCALTKQTR